MKRNLYFYLSKQSNFETEEFRKHDLNLQTYDQFACMKGQLIKHVWSLLQQLILWEKKTH